MADPVRIIGSYLSPYVRKALVVLEHKGIAYEIDPIVPFFGDDRFSKLSPLRRIPVLIDGAVTLSDSSVICQYLEDRYPTPAVYPADIADRARARWLEEYADSRMGDVFIWRLFNEVAIKPFVWGGATDTESVQRTLTEDIPEVLAYLESLPGGRVCSVRCRSPTPARRLPQRRLARFRIDEARWRARRRSSAASSRQSVPAAAVRGSVDARAAGRAARGRRRAGRAADSGNVRDDPTAPRLFRQQRSVAAQPRRTRTAWSTPSRNNATRPMPRSTRPGTPSSSIAVTAAARPLGFSTSTW
jgi:glutathione S-transferase